MVLGRPTQLDNALVVPKRSRFDRTRRIVRTEQSVISAFRHLLVHYHLVTYCRLYRKSDDAGREQDLAPLWSRR